MKDKFAKIGLEVGELVDRKNSAYGNSFAKSAAFFTLLYPEGIKPAQYTNVLLLARIFDKIVRITNDPYALDEDAFRDIAGYGLLGLLNNGSNKKKIVKRSKENVK